MNEVFVNPMPVNSLVCGILPVLVNLQLFHKYVCTLHIFGIVILVCLLLWHTCVNQSMIENN